MIQLSAEIQAAAVTLGFSGMVALIVQLWKLADRLARVDERLVQALECCSDARKEQAKHAIEIARLGAQ